ELLLADRPAQGQRRIAADVQLRPALVGLAPLHLRLVLSDLRHGLLDLGLTRADLSLGLAELGLGLQEFGLRLVERRLERSRIDLEQGVAGFHRRALLVILAHEVPADAGADLRVDVPDQRSHVLQGDRHVLLDHGRDPDHGQWGWRGSSGSVAAAGDRGCREYDDAQVCSWAADQEWPRGPTII